MKDVLVTVKGRDTSDMEQAMELVTEGRLYKEEDAYFVSYNESGMTGMEGTTTTLKVETGKVTLIRKGTISSTFVFEKGKRNVSHYSTEYGVFTVGVTAEEIDSRLDDAGGFVSIVYSLEFFGKEPGKNEFLMTIREVNDDLHGGKGKKAN